MSLSFCHFMLCRLLADKFWRHFWPIERWGRTNNLNTFNLVCSGTQDLTRHKERKPVAIIHNTMFKWTLNDNLESRSVRRYRQFWTGLILLFSCKKNQPSQPTIFFIFTSYKNSKLVDSLALVICFRQSFSTRTIVKSSFRKSVHSFFTHKTLANKLNHITVVL